MPRSARRVRFTLALGTVALCAAVLVGCNPEKHSAPTGTGSLAVTVNAANGTAPEVVITQANGFTKTITKTQTLTGLEPGSYSIVADSAMGADSIVGSIIDTATVTGSPAAVTSGGVATATVSYTQKSRVGGMWVADNDSPTIPDYSSDQLLVSGTPVPAETLVTRVSEPAGLALDANGNMWVSSDNSDSLLMYTPAERQAGGATAPSVVIVSTALDDAEDLAFDAQGNLWVANCDGEVFEYTPNQLAAGGVQSPAVTISGEAANMDCEYALTFDANGDLWVADNDHSFIVEYSPAQLVASGNPVPIDTIGSTTGPTDFAVKLKGAKGVKIESPVSFGSLAFPTGLAFDASGNLWVSNGVSSVVAYTPAQLAASGAPVPATTLKMPLSSDLNGVAFDHRGTLWVSDDNLGVMYGLTSGQLRATGDAPPTVTPAITLTGQSNGFEPQQPLFDPTATAVTTSARRLIGSARSVSGPHHHSRNWLRHHSS